MFFLRDSSALQIEQSIHGALAVPQDAAQFPPPPISGAENLAERNGFTGKFRADGAAQELVFVEDADLCHVPRIEPQRDRFPNVRSQRCRDVAEALEVNPIGPAPGAPLPLESTAGRVVRANPASAAKSRW